MAQPGPGLHSPARLLELLTKSSGSGDEPPLEEMMEALQNVQATQLGGATAQPPSGQDKLEVFPEPGFVIKTANEQGQKVFINVCGSTKMPMPAGWEEKGGVPAEVRRHLEEMPQGDAPPCMQLPLAMGRPRLDSDHRGQVCMVVDCLTSSQVLALCPDYRPLKFFLISLAMMTAAKMTGQELNPHYKLPKMRYKGEGAPPPQLIRLAERDAGGGGPAPPRPGSGGKQLIAEMPAAGEEGRPSFALLANKRQRQAAPAALAATQPAGDGGSAPGGGEQQGADEAGEQEAGEQHPVLEQLVARVGYRGRPAAAVAITVPLPAAVAATARRHPGAVAASVCAETVRVQAPGCQPLEVRLPFAVSARGGTADVVAAGSGSGGGSLVLVLPYRPFASVLDELRQAAGTADGSPSSSSLSELD